MEFNTTQMSLFLPSNDTWLNSSYSNLSYGVNEMPVHQFPPYSGVVFRIITYLKLYFTPSVITIGVLGNTLSWITLLRSKLQNFSSSHYLVALCVVNNIYLLATLLKWLSIHGMEVHTRPGLCQVMSFMESSAIFLSNWYVVAFCTDRYIALCWPTEGIRLCTKVRARTVITALCIISTVIYINMSITEGVVMINGKSRCLPLPFFLHNLQVLVAIKFVLNLILPYLCIVLLGLLITINVYIMHIRDVFSDDNSPSLLKQTTFVYILLYFLLHTPYELYHLNRIIRGIIKPWYVIQSNEILAQAFLMHVFNFSMAIHLPIYVFTYPLFRNYLKQDWVTLCQKCTRHKQSKPGHRTDIEFSGVKQADESVV